MLDAALRHSGAHLECLTLMVDSLANGAGVNVGGAALGGILTLAGPTLRQLTLLYECSTDSLQSRGGAAGEEDPYHPFSAIAAETACMRSSLAPALMQLTTLEDLYIQVPTYGGDLLGPRFMGVALGPALGCMTALESLQFDGGLVSVLLPDILKARNLRELRLLMVPEHSRDVLVAISTIAASVASMRMLHAEGDSWREGGAATGFLAAGLVRAARRRNTCLRVALPGCGFTPGMATRMCCQAATDRVIFEFEKS